LLSRAWATGASRMAQTALERVVSGAEVGHRAANRECERTGA
jgi:hypothetical protein